METELRIMKAVLLDLIRAIHRGTDAEHLLMHADMAQEDVERLLGIKFVRVESDDTHGGK